MLNTRVVPKNWFFKLITLLSTFEARRDKNDFKKMCFLVPKPFFWVKIVFFLSKGSLSGVSDVIIGRIVFENARGQKLSPHVNTVLCVRKEKSEHCTDTKGGNRLE